MDPAGGGPGGLGGRWSSCSGLGEEERDGRSLATKACPTPWKSLDLWVGSGPLSLTEGQRYANFANGGNLREDFLLPDGAGGRCLHLSTSFPW